MADVKAGTFQLTGFSDLERKLEALPDALALKVLRGAMRAGAAVIQQEARALAPISDKPHLLGKGTKKTWIQPGSMRKGIRIRLAPFKSRSVPVEMWVYVQKNLWYWKFQEFGTAHNAAQPFMRPAFNAHKEKAVEAVRVYLAARIEKEVANL